MAKKPKKAELSEQSQSKKKLLERIHDRHKVMTDADEPNRRLGKIDLSFVNEPGKQWDENMKKERGDRPCLEANTLRINGKRVINEIRANRPQGHVRAVEGGDKKGAELREGLVRNILNISDFDTITDQAAEYQVDAGFGAWRVDSEYADDSMWDQDLIVNPIKDPLNSVWWDPSCEDILLKRDADDWMIVKRMSNKAYEAKYGGAEKFDFDGEEDVEDWEDKESVRVVEYWYKEPYDKELWLVEIPNQETGEIDRLTVDSTSDEAAALKKQPGFMPTKTRMVRCHKIMMCVASGTSILEGPAEQGGSQFPFVVVFGEVKVIDGKVRWWGLHRFSKDAQQIQNIFWTSAAETVASAPKAHTWATPAQAAGLLPSWAEAHRQNIPHKLYNPDPLAPGAPVQHPGAQVPVAMLEMVGLSADLVRSTSGLHEEAFGEESNAKSGIAIGRKQRQAAVVTYNFPDNMAKSAKRTGEIILDRIPIVYDADRELRILGADGAEDYRRVNHVVFDPATGKSTRVDDLTSGKYDYYVKAGPSYSSMLEEAEEFFGEIITAVPELMPVIGDLMFKASNKPYSDEMAKRMQHFLLPPIQKQLSEGKDIPPEAQAAMAQVEQAMQVVQQQTQLVQAAAQEVEQSKVASDQAKVNAEKVLADIQVARAQFDADMEKRMAALTKKEADIAIREAGLSMQASDIKAQEAVFHGEVKANEMINSQASETKQTVAEIDGMVAQFIEAVGQALTSLKGEVDKPKPKMTVSRIKREGGRTIAETQYDDGSVKRIGADRQNGELVAVPLD